MTLKTNSFLPHRYKEHDVRLVEASGQFSRAQALEIGAKLFPLDALLFFVDVDMIFDDGLVRRISWNTQQGRSVYFPIVFSQYDPEQIAKSDKNAPVTLRLSKTPEKESRNSSSKLQPPAAQISLNKTLTPALAPPSANNASKKTRSADNSGNKSPLGGTTPLTTVTDDRHGYWRQFGFGIVSIFHSDLMMVGGLDTTIEGWGKEDVDLFDKIVASNLTVFRAPDPGLVHVYHPIHCSAALSKQQAEMCRGTKLASTASWDDLAAQVEKKFPELLDN